MAAVDTAANYALNAAEQKTGSKPIRYFLGLPKQLLQNIFALSQYENLE